MSNLNSETINVNMIIDIPYGMTYDKSLECLKDFVSRYCANWFYIFHDKDVKDVDSGDLKTPHYHLLFNSSDNKKHRLMWYLNRCAECFGKATLNFMQIMIWKDYEGDIQYLIHKNDGDKHHYKIEEVSCFCPRKELEDIMSVEVHKGITLDTIIKVCSNSASLTQVYFTLGLGYSQMYRCLIKDIWDDIKKRSFK